MRRLPAKAARHITAASLDLDKCLEHPEQAHIWIQGALRNVREANQWIVARQLIEEMQKRSIPGDPSASKENQPL